MHALWNSEMSASISGGLIACKSMEIAFQTKQSVHIIIDGHISEVSIRWHSTVCSVFPIE